MNIYLKENIKVRKPIVFLCGSTYLKNSFDKRNIFKKYIEEKLDGNVHVLIIDDFMSKERMEDILDIKIFEEIFASIASITYVFVESFSSAAELGLFSSYKFNNNLVAILPRAKNLLNNKIGYFVKEIMLDEIYDLSVEYNPKVQRYAYGTDYVDEHYYFYSNKLPIEIENDFLKRQSIFDEKYEIKIFEYNNLIKSLNFLEFSYDVNYARCYINEKTLFYIVSALVEGKFSQSEITEKNIDEELVTELYNEIRDIICDTIYLYKNILINAEIHILNYKDNIIEYIKYAVHFNKYFYQHLLNQSIASEKNIIKFQDILTKNKIIFLKKANEIFEFDYENFSSTDNKRQFIKKFNIYNNKKVRKIVTYQCFEDNLYRKNHIKINYYIRNFLNKKRIFNDNSFAYKEGFNTLKCLEKHRKSYYFLKLDISKFFESINVDCVYNNFIDLMKNDINNHYNNVIEKEKFQKIIFKIIQEACYDNQFPIGFITSPIISEISMLKFDNTLNEYLNNIDSNIVYTRYADDILISSDKQFDKSSIYFFVENELKKINLELNKSKIQFKDLAREGEYIKFVGLNLVYGEKENKISIGRKFIRELAKLIVYKKNKTEYDLKREIGMINYLKYNDLRGYKRLQEIIKVYKCDL